VDEHQGRFQKIMTKQLLFFLGVRTAIAVIAVGVSFAPPWSLARAERDSASSGGMDEIEGLFSKDEETDTETPKASPTPRPAASQAAKTDVKQVTDLSKLQPFSDVAVVQKRFLPKSERFEFYIAPALMLNDAFFLDFGAAARFTYYFQERYGLELAYNYLTTATRTVTNNLASRNVHTQSFVSPEGFYGADFKWVPVYGKMTWRNQVITPFDIYFSFGLGLTPTNQGNSAATLHLGMGQAFAFSKSGALRWDFSWFMYDSTSTTAGGSSSALYNNLLFSIGWSFFFPEATYR